MLRQGIGEGDPRVVGPFSKATALAVALALSLVGTSASTGASAAERTLVHDAYVWQRRWTPELHAALHAAAPLVRAWRVLAASVDAGGRVVVVDVDTATLRAARKPVVPVVRINGQLSGWDEAALVARIEALIGAWKEAGVDLAGLEIDHDCAASGLGRYAGFVHRLRAGGSAIPVLAITVLPAWMEEPDLATLLAGVDEAVLQVHAVSRPDQGLFETKRARAWVARFARLSPVPFRVALPTYGSRVTFDAKGRAIAVESEVPLDTVGGSGVELDVDPRDVAGLWKEWRDESPRGLIGLAWFRLPTHGDRRAWSFETWRAVVEGQTLASRLEVRAVPAASPGLFDVVVRNSGEVDAALPARLRVAASASCSAADGLGEYRTTFDGSGVTFQLRSSPKIQATIPTTIPKMRARRQRTIGWLRCLAKEVEVHALP